MKLKKITLSLSKALLSFGIVASLVLPSSVAYAAEVESEAEVNVIEAEDQIEPNVSEVKRRSDINDYEFIDVALYEDNMPFTSMSAREVIQLDMDCDAITLKATCVGNEADTSLLCEITGSDYSDFIPFTADGSLTTIPLYLPKGLYKIRFYGNSAITKNYTFVLFTKVKVSILPTKDINAYAQTRANSSKNTPVVK